jgi:hypothetical protein
MEMDPISRALSTLPKNARQKIQMFFDKTDPRTHAWILTSLDEHGIIRLSDANRRNLVPLLPARVSSDTPVSSTDTPVSSTDTPVVTPVSSTDTPVVGNNKNNKKNASAVDKKNKKKKKSDDGGRYKLADEEHRCNKGFRRVRPGSRHCVVVPASSQPRHKTSAKPRNKKSGTNTNDRFEAPEHV